MAVKKHSSIWGKLQYFAGTAMAAIISASALLIGISQFYRGRSETEHYDEVVVRDIDTCYMEYGEPLVPTWSSTYRVFAEDLPYPVDFSKERWDSTVKE